MAGADEVKKPTSSRLFSILRPHLGFVVLMAVAIPLTLAFAWQGVIATVGDDSVSYITLARHFSHRPDAPFLAPWVPFVGHFPPLFPLLLAGSGGASNYLVAHELVAAFALVALLLVYLYAAPVLRGNASALALVAVFLLTPGAGIGITGILSESLYLLVSFGALLFYERHLASGRAKAVEWLLFGVLLACVYLTRVIGIVMVAAYALATVVRLARTRHWDHRWLLPAVPVVLLGAAWIALRPTGDSNTYREITAWMVGQWRGDPARQALDALTFLADGWIASFNAQADIGLVPRVVLGALGLLGLAGAILRALDNHLDGWYTLGSLAIILFWVFPADNMRRLLYPFIPLLLLLAAYALLVLCRAIGAGAHAKKIVLAAAAFPALLCLPAALLTLAKARDTNPVIDGFAYSYSDITDYYTTINIDEARAAAGKHLAVLAGIEALARVTPTGSKVMWMRPEYVALLGDREGVPWYYEWDEQELAKQVKATGTAYLVVPGLFKADLTDTITRGERSVTLASVAKFSRPVFGLANKANGRDEFILMQVEPAMLDAFLAASR